MFFNWLRKKEKLADSYHEVNLELERLGSSLRVEDRIVKNKNRKSKIYLNYIDFWENGIKWLGIQGVKNPKDMALLIFFWNERCMCSSEIEEYFPDIQFPTSRKKIEEGESAYLDWFWRKQLEKKDQRFKELIELCATHPLTSSLVTFVELRDFGFSRSIGKINGLKLNDLPRIRITDDWEYEVRTPSMAYQEYAGKQPREFLGRGDAHQAFSLLLEYLPPNCGPATYQRGVGCCPPPAA